MGKDCISQLEQIIISALLFGIPAKRISFLGLSYRIAAIKLFVHSQKATNNDESDELSH